MTVIGRRSLAALPVLLAGGARAAMPAQATLIVPFAPGGGTDLVFRLLAPAAGERLGTRFVIENRGGGATVPGMQAMTRQPADGAALAAVSSALLIAAALRRDMPFDWRSALAPVLLVADVPYVVTVRADAGPRDLAALLAMAARAEQPPAFASGGFGTVSHLAGELLAQRAGVRLLHVPYARGDGPAIADLLAGQVALAVTTLPAAAPHLAAGTLRALAVTTAARAAALPDVPTVAEQGIGGFDVGALIGLAGPAGLPAPLAAGIADAFTAAMAEPALRARLLALGVAPVGGTPERFAARLAAEAAMWAEVVTRGGIAAG